MAMLVLRSCLCVGVVALAAGVLVADEKDHRKVAEELYAVMEYEKSFEVSLAGTVEYYVKQYPEYANHREALKRTYRKVYDMKDVREEIVKMAMKEFTEKELKEIMAFYRSPVGKKMIAKQPAMVKHAHDVSAKMMTSKQDEFFKTLQEEMDKDK
jgi:uncharacterized protein